MKHGMHGVGRRFLVFATLIGLASAPSRAQVASLAPQHAPDHDWVGVSHLVMPQTRAFALERGRDPIVIERIEARVEIIEQAAVTTLEIAVRNPSSRPAEVVLLLPVPEDAAVHSFLFEGSASEKAARLLPRDEARRTYDGIVAQIKDPALLEFAGWNLIRSSVFPVPANGTQRVRLSYDHVLTAEHGRVDYVLPRSESLTVEVPWSIQVGIRSRSPISLVYSPSHELVTSLREPRHVALHVHERRASDPGAFRFSYLLEQGELSASLIAYPDTSIGGGYFLLMAGLPAGIDARAPRVAREVTLVIDRSGSMAGPKLDQARAAANQVIEALEFGEDFNIVDYSTQVAQFAPRPVTKDATTLRAAREYIATMRAMGGTNIAGALVEALRPAPRAGVLPIVLFLTDGLPTVGRTAELAIRDLVEHGNLHARRIFTFGVGNDVNVPLLDRIADVTRAASTYVLPREDVELAVARVFGRSSGPVLSDLELGSYDGQGNPTTRAVRDLAPARLPDLFAGDQLLVLGRYVGGEPIDFRLSGTLRGERRTFAFRFGLDTASTRNAFVPRLWATRHIALLVDQVRQAGADFTNTPAEIGRSLFTDPRFKEIADEILALSTRFGVLSEYTAFLSLEGTNLGDWEGLRAACTSELDSKAVRTRSGAGAVNQGLNHNERKLTGQLDYKNGYWDSNQQRVELSGVQQVCDRAFFKRGAQWIDAGILLRKSALAPARTIEFGSSEHALLLEKLITEGRQGLLALEGEILIELGGENVLIHNR
ncbi:MAG: VIT domain-containing protein [Planctomycetota bacterium]